MRIAVVSDLHMEYHDGPIPAGLVVPLAAGEADVLVLAGDVAGTPSDLVTVVGALPDMPILMVLGNHEFVSVKLCTPRLGAFELR